MTTRHGRIVHRLSGAAEERRLLRTASGTCWRVSAAGRDAQAQLQRFIEHHSLRDTAEVRADLGLLKGPAEALIHPHREDPSR